MRVKDGKKGYARAVEKVRLLQASMKVWSLLFLELRKPG